MQVISVFNQKGGCGKSTTCSNLGAYLARHGKKVLLIDMDPQANLTVSVGVNDDELEETIYTLLQLNSKELTRERILEVMKETSYERLLILPSDITLSNAEISLASVMSREHVLKRIIEQIGDYFDYVLIDCPPSLGLLSVNSLVASDYLIIPVTPQFFSIKGIKHLMETYTLIKDTLNPNLEIMGVLVTMYDKRKNIAKDIRTTLVEVFGDKVFNTVIRQDVQIEYSQDNQTPIIYYNDKCRSHEDYKNLGREVLAWQRV
ncbi:AAA family ATPase [Clostridium sp. MSJ-11]|uniref:AAA family ATPase n=1 Tax=Clostridium mobile TaxID=2841512 RepID=A0ABS6EMI4_9CLOT|nr:ParA family protein [Clostridium mobile]MBU5486450.1 AAA family ATPase [Clostridium mobile]